VAAGSVPAMLAGAGALAIAANTYELLCTFGFPMVYTRILTLHDLPVSVYYLYLLAYNVIYVIPLLLIVLGFAVALESRRLAEREGRVLKLLSGLMMLLLGLVLVFLPELLNQVGTAVLLLSLAILITLVIALQEFALKLISGAALLLLALVYFAVPERFEQFGAAFALLVATLLLTVTLVWLDHRHHPHGQPPVTRGSRA
jgi:drug/metabolite transporter (DMT)-like permease